MLKTAVAIRHIAFEDLGFFEPVLEEAGYKVHYYDAGQDDLWTLDPIRTSLIVVLGGPMGVYERAEHPFLDEEIQLIQDRLAAGKPLLGICLGAQLIAHALGARVYPGPRKEIGLSTIRLTDAGRSSPLAAIGPDDPVLHWHGDTFELPRGADLLASTDAFSHQAFSVGRNVLALQFHLEAGDAIDDWLTGHAEELAAEGIDTEELGRQVRTAAPRLKQVAGDALSTWLRQLSD